MSSSYPTSLDSLSTGKTDSTATGSNDHAGHHNDLADAVNKIETELGTLPKGSYTDLRRRLEKTTQFGGNQVYTGLRDLGSAGIPIAWTMDPETCSIATDVSLTAQRIAGMAFMVNQSVSCTGLAIQVSTAGTSFRNYSGGALYLMNSNGDWQFVVDTGANSTTLFASTGYNSQSWTGSQTLTPGLVYVAAIISDWTGTTPVIAGVANARLINMGQTSGCMRNAGRESLTARQNATIVNANLAAKTNAPLIALI